MSETLSYDLVNGLRSDIATLQYKLTALRAENEGLKEFGKKAGEEIKHLRACIVYQAENKVAIEQLRSDKRELVEACEKVICAQTVKEIYDVLYSAVAKHRE